MTKQYLEIFAAVCGSGSMTRPAELLSVFRRVGQVLTTDSDRWR